MRERVADGDLLRRAIEQRPFSTSRLNATLRDRATAYAQRRCAEGIAQVVIAAELGVSTMSVSRWLRDGVRGQASHVALVPVQVIADTQPVATAVGVELVTPNGLRVLGLDVETLCTLLQRFG